MGESPKALPETQNHLVSHQAHHTLRTLQDPLLHDNVHPGCPLDFYHHHGIQQNLNYHPYPLFSIHLIRAQGHPHHLTRIETMDATTYQTKHCAHLGLQDLQRITVIHLSIQLGCVILQVAQRSRQQGILHCLHQEGDDHRLQRIMGGTCIT